MKLVTFDAGQVGYIDGETVVELDVPNTREFFGREGQVPETGRTFPLAQVRLRAPIAPKKFFHTSGNFRENEGEPRQVGWSHPMHKGIVFFQNVDAIVGPDEAVVHPEHLTSELDCEPELAIVIGRPGKFFTPEQALSHIMGYAVFNGVTARDIQRREVPSGASSFCKAIDTFAPLGPWIVTADEIPDPHNLRMELRVNGETRQGSHTSRMIVSIPELVAYHSPQGYSAGDLITTGPASGTAGGNPVSAGPYLKPGDQIEAEIEGVGVLRSPVISWQEAHGTTPGRPREPRRPAEGTK
ncbi:fumarylacetoacetate hydrolase family protein [Streptomyces phaeolivaceus]|uniref:Fumarylacetoacetate hydrolase family protein n=1 Tax=Streptomyces phaeolivaceus TaxID=2653200 RepID=A0A5P8KEG9_9ACTN|nr:fumarylacetoacetate hydrolase family protein [Streptomyces phaeolivaceus]QFR01734.1 fumarylacetoacetate hydrolase family protein [Streptomyces phaeolivaceus]